MSNSVSQKRLIFGMGTGRCGTKSLSMLLGKQTETNSSHEAFRMPWNFSEKALGDYVTYLTGRSNQRVQADVALYLLPYAKRLLKMGHQFVVMRRPRAEVIASFENHVPRFNHWQVHDGQQWQQDAWDEEFPKFSAATRAEAIGAYWDLYEERTAELCENFPDRIRVFEMDHLAQESEVTGLLQWLGFSEPKLPEQPVWENRKRLSKVKLKGPAADKQRAIIFQNSQSPGDIVMLTAAVRDLHRAAPGRFRTDVQTPCPGLWENNPHLTPLEPAKAQSIQCHYPLIHRSNMGLWHFIHGFHQYLSQELQLSVAPTELKGDIHLSPSEKASQSLVERMAGFPLPFWIVVSGGKYDFTAKWWDPSRLQAVVDHFRGRVLFAQVGEEGHEHPPLRGAIDLRGKTTLREFVVLMHHAQGVVCPVTLAMHLAAAVETRGKCGAYPLGLPKLRPCVVIGGGREPMQWEAYPGHQFIHTIGALDCCETGGCWKSRVVPLPDDDFHNRNLCSNVVRVDARSGARLTEGPVPGHRFEPRDGTRPLPLCHDLISSDEVIRRVETYFSGGVVNSLTRTQANECAERLPLLGWTRSVERSEVGFSFNASSAPHTPEVAIQQPARPRTVTLCLLANGDSTAPSAASVRALRELKATDGCRIAVGSTATPQTMYAALRRLAAEGLLDHWKDSRAARSRTEMLTKLINDADGEYVCHISGLHRIPSSADLLANIQRVPETGEAIPLLGMNRSQRRELFGWVAAKRWVSQNGLPLQEAIELAADAELGKKEGGALHRERERYRELLEGVVRFKPPVPTVFAGTGIVICGGGEKYLPSAWVCIRMLRQHGCELPIELWHLGQREMPARFAELVQQYDVTCLDGLATGNHSNRWLGGWQLKCHALIHSRFAEVLLLDADNVPLRNPGYLFQTQEYREHGALFWPDFGRLGADREIWEICGIVYQDEAEFESGQIVIDKARCWHALQVAMHLNQHSNYYYRYIWGDKETFHLAWRKLNQSYAMPQRTVGRLRHTMVQHDFIGEPIFLHRNSDKWALDRENERIPGFSCEDDCRIHLRELASLWDGSCPRGSRWDLRERRSVNPSLKNELLTATFVFHRIGHDFRAMTFRADKRVGLGATSEVVQWELRDGSEGPELVLSDSTSATFILRHAWDGGWRGHVVDAKNALVELTPQPRRLGRPPIDDGHSGEFAATLPRIIHQIWLGPKPLSRQEKSWMTTWRKFHPDWDYQLWTDVEVRHLDLRCRPLFDQVSNFAMKADLLRCELLSRYGGVYADVDFECLRPLEPLLKKVDTGTFAGFEWPTVTHVWSICNALLGSLPGAEFMEYLLSSISQSAERYSEDSEWHGAELIPRSTGPAFLTRSAGACGEITVFPAPVFYPRAAELREAFACHHFRGNWR